MVGVAEGGVFLILIQPHRFVVDVVVLAVQQPVEQPALLVFHLHRIDRRHDAVRPGDRGVVVARVAAEAAADDKPLQHLLDRDALFLRLLRGIALHRRNLAAQKRHEADREKADAGADGGRHPRGVADRPAQLAARGNHEDEEKLEEEGEADDDREGVDGDRLGVLALEDEEAAERVDDRRNNPREQRRYKPRHNNRHDAGHKRKGALFPSPRDGVHTAVDEREADDATGHRVVRGDRKVVARREQQPDKSRAEGADEAVHEHVRVARKGGGLRDAAAHRRGHVTAEAHCAGELAAGGDHNDLHERQHARAVARAEGIRKIVRTVAARDEEAHHRAHNHHPYVGVHHLDVVYRKVIVRGSDKKAKNKNKNERGVPTFCLYNYY
ncbi:hypothetical protein STCU_10116 [Strigomonas culicis]|uniref:Uncharacterized protein n=1 Tax=Strigomonas culicis TaxID=28005 RepID=S9TJF5_9TRYP|nr:hypothetical protein STCU_10116 [Strigomonas culicis]|eukprot:EPY18212.1 hypothetical protein STCU_10116 [Strigomonas culicis]